MERIDEIAYTKDADGLQVQETPFYNGPAEFLVQELCFQLRQVPQWAKIFSNLIDPYKRMDYSMRDLPVLRIYNDQAIKEYESWYVAGDLKADIIFPASVRRNETQQVQDTVSSALMQQFRRPEFFNLMVERVPGLNELGKRFSIDKSLGFEWGEDLVPLTQITINFRLNLEQWDLYLEETLRTKDSPFEKVLGSLDKIVTTIQGLRDDNAVETTVGLDQNV